MNDDLISRDDLIDAKPEFMNEKIVRDTKYRTAKERVYANAWNNCNSCWLNIIKNAPTVEQECYITGAQWNQFMKEHRRRTGAYDKIKAIINGWAVDDDEHELLEQIADIISEEEENADTRR